MPIELASPSAAEHREAIREAIRAGTATAQDFIAYNLLRGHAALRGFTPTTNPTRQAHGRGPFDGFIRALGPTWGPKLCRQMTERLNPQQVAQAVRARVGAACDTYLRAQLQGLPMGHLVGLLIRAMLVTPHGTGSVFQHNRSVRSRALALRRAGAYVCVSARKRDVPPWLPDWFLAGQTMRLSNQDSSFLSAYWRFHDCGKPFVYDLDVHGGACFPDHARASARVWAEMGGSGAMQRLATRVYDLDTMEAPRLEAFAREPLSKVLLVLALARLWADERDLGGADSPQFQRRLAHLDACGRELCERWDALPQGISQVTPQVAPQVTLDTTPAPAKDVSPQ